MPLRTVQLRKYQGCWTQTKRKSLKLICLTFPSEVKKILVIPVDRDYQVSILKVQFDHPIALQTVDALHFECPGNPVGLIRPRKTYRCRFLCTFPPPKLDLN